MLIFLAELLDSSTYFTARHNEWDESEFVFATNAREIQSEDIASTLILDECTTYYLQGKPLKMRRGIWKMSSDGYISIYEPTQRELCSLPDDWVLMDNTDVVLAKQKRSGKTKDIE